MNDNLPKIETKSGIVNDMFLATIKNPNATTYDFLNNNVNPLNTRLLDRDAYRDKSVIKAQFTRPDGKFDEAAFNAAYNKALFNYNQISNEEAIKNLDDVKYNPFSVTRPKEAKVWDVKIEFSKDINPFKQLYSRDWVNSVTDNPLSPGEIAQSGKVLDTRTGEWLDSANKKNIFDKFFGETLVYAQWDEDGVHTDPITGNTVNHKKGDWKFDPDGNLYLETLGDREVYGKQVVSPTDILTTDGSVFNKFDFLDSDGRTKSVGKVAAKAVAEVAPLLIPGLNTWYAGTRAAVSLASVLPTFYKSLEGLLIGDEESIFTDPVTKAEGWLAKFNQSSKSEEASRSFWNLEQMSDMVTSVFSQIYEQRAMASLSRVLMKPDKLLDKRTAELQNLMSKKAYEASTKYGIDAKEAIRNAVQDLPELQEIYRKQSQFAKALSLGYMALTSTGNVYGQAIDSGYDKRTAGFASLLTAAGQYGIMMNNRMGDWFLDKTTGYSIGVNNALMNKAIKPYLEQTDDILKNSGLSIAAKRTKLAELSTKFKRNLDNMFTGPSVLGEAMFRNAMIEGAEEVTEQMVQDATQGIIDVMGYLGLTKERGNLRIAEKYTSGEFLQEYLANFIGGVLGGGLFELERFKINPWLSNDNKSVSNETKKELIELIAGGHKEELKDMIRKESKKLTNDFLSYVTEDGEFKPKETVSQADAVANLVIGMVDQLDTVLNSEGLNLTDEQIIDKAIRTKVILDRFEELKSDDKPFGIEALVLDDLKNTMVKIAPLKAEIMNLEKDPENNKEQIKLKREELKGYSSRVNDILEGKLGMEYFNQLLMLLDKPIISKYGSFDRDTYTKAVYKKSYDELPETGIVTKESVNKEWQDYIDSTDIKSKLKTATNAFLNNEKLINPIIAQYHDTGYSVERSKVYKDVIDLAKTAYLFHNSNPQEKQKWFTHFIDVMNNLESKGTTKVGAWDVYKTSIFDEFLNNSMIKRVDYGIDNEGNIVKNTSDIDDKYLSEVDENGVSNRENAENIINEIVARQPSQALDTRFLIDTYNSIIDNRNADIINTINRLESKENKTEEDYQVIDSLKKSIFSIGLTYAENPAAYEEEKEKAKNKIVVEVESRFPELFTENEPNESKLSKVDSILENYTVLKQNSALYEKTVDDIIKDEVGEVKENFDDYSRSDLINIFSRLKNIGILDQISLKYSDINEELEKIESGEYDKDTLKNILSITNEHILESKAILGNPKYEDLLNKLSNINEELSKNLNLYTPDIMKLQNVAFSTIIRALDSGILDRELFNEAKNIVNNDLLVAKNKLFKNGDNLGNDDFINIINNIDTIVDRISSLSPDVFFSDESLGDYEPYEGLYLMTLADLLQTYDAFYSGDFSSIPDFFKEEGRYMDEEDFNYYSEKFKNEFGEDWPLLRKVLENFDDPDAYASSVILNISSGLNKNSVGNAINNYEILSKYEKNTNNFISNPLYDFLRKYFISLDSGKKPLTILDILQREETSYNAASGASNFISDDIREQDVRQAIQMLELLKVNIMAASQSDVNGELLGFITLRKKYAEKSGIKDDVLDLRTISSDEGQSMINDIDRLIIRLDFISGLATFNRKRTAVEQEEIGRKMDNVLLSTWDTIIKSEIGNEFIPLEAIQNALSSNKKSSAKLLDIEDAVYEHNKNRKIDAFRVLIRNFEGAVVGERSNITKDMTSADVVQMDLINYLATTLAVKSSSYWTRRRKNLEREGKAPFYMQELVAKETYASIVNPDLFAETFNVKKNALKDDTSSITIVLGSAGSGKTTAIMGSVINDIKDSNPKSTIWLSAPSQLQTDNLTKAIIDVTGNEGLYYTSFNKKQLFSQFGSEVEKLYDRIQDSIRNLDSVKTYTWEQHQKGEDRSELFSIVNDALFFNIPEDIYDKIDLSKAPNLLIIDEVTHFSNPELQLLHAISQVSKKSNSNFMKVVGLGDQNQLGYKVKHLNQYINFNIEGINAIFTPVLLTSVRASNDQQRVNNDLLLNLASKADNITSDIADVATANAMVRSMLSDVNVVTGLKYYLDNNSFKGTYIAHSYRDLNPLSVIAREYKNAKKNNKTVTIGVITSTGDIDEELLSSLDKVGLSKDDITIFSANNVQGSEVDYMIFGTEDILKYDKLKENLRALYTFASRSRSASIIIDPDNKLNDVLSITNADKSLYYIDYDPLTPTLIEDLKKKRLQDLDELLKNIDSQLEDFKWISGITTTTPNTDIDFGAVANPNLYLDTPEDNKSLKIMSGKIKANDFKIMLHSFYNSPGAKLSIEDGKPSKITVDKKMPNFDLNGLKNVTSKDKAENIINQWASLKYNILNKRPIKSTDYKDYLSHIFAGNFNNPTNINVEYMTIVQRYNEEYHYPYAKYEGDSSLYLKNTDLFINLVAKISIGDKSHFITLANFPTKDTLLSEGLKQVDGDVSTLESKINDFYDKLEHDIPLDFKGFKKLNNIDISSFQPITSTRLVTKDLDNKSIYTLDTLSYKIPGLKYSNIKIFPGNINDFKNYINKYSFGEKRSDEELERLFTILRNKPHIVVSFDSDLNGSNENSQAKLMPIGSKSRKLNELIDEILNLKKDANIELTQFYKNTSNGVYTPSKELNARFETVLNPSQILDMLIKWAQTNVNIDGNNIKLIDLLSKEIDFKNTNELYKGNKSVLDLINNFKESTVTGEKLKDVIKIVKDTINNNPKAEAKEIKDSVIKQIRKGYTGWHWNFYNLFAYADIIDQSFKKKIFEMVKSGYLIDRDIDFESEGLKELKGNIEKLFYPIKNWGFYYNVPISLDKNSNIVANEYISGEHGFSPKYFSDKFFITSTPEGPRLLLDFNSVINSNPTIVDESKAEPVPDIVKEVTRNTEKEPILDLIKEQTLNTPRNPISSTNSDSTVYNNTIDISSIEIKDVNGNIIKPFTDFNVDILPGLLDGANMLNRKDEAISKINDAINTLVTTISTGSNILGVPKTGYEAIRDFLISLAEFGDGYVEDGDLPTSIDIIKAFYGEISKLPKEVKEKIKNSNFRNSLNKLIKNINQCK